MANRSELSNTFQRVEGMIQYVRENLDDEEYCVFLDMVAPLPEPRQSTKKAGRKSSKKSASKSSSKSSRASGMAAAIKDNLQQREPTVGGFADDADMLHCSDCGADSDDNVHHKRTDKNYHPFVSAAQPARGKSSTNGGATSGTVNSETGKEDVSSVHHAGD